MIITGPGGDIRERGEVCDLVALHCEVGMVAGLISKRASTETPRSWIIHDIETTHRHRTLVGDGVQSIIPHGEGMEALEDNNLVILIPRRWTASFFLIQQNLHDNPAA